jgi:hypothetical protein
MSQKHLLKFFPLLPIFIRDGSDSGRRRKRHIRQKRQSPAIMDDFGSRTLSVEGDSTISNVRDQLTNMADSYSSDANAAASGNLKFLSSPHLPVCVRSDLVVSPVVTLAPVTIPDLTKKVAIKQNTEAECSAKAADFTLAT